MAWPSRMSRQTRSYNLHSIWLTLGEAHGAKETHFEEGRVEAESITPGLKTLPALSQVMDLPR